MASPPPPDACPTRRRLADELLDDWAEKRPIVWKNVGRDLLPFLTLLDAAECDALRERYEENRPDAVAVVVVSFVADGSPLISKDDSVLPEDFSDAQRYALLVLLCHAFQTVGQAYYFDDRLFGRDDAPRRVEAVLDATTGKSAFVVVFYGA